jgi:hypothetical protein
VKAAAIVCGLLALAFGGWSPGVAKDLSSAETFEELKKLCGEWKGTTAKGGAEKISYRLIAADTVLLESWVLSSGREALTIYHRDGADLIATHYCPRGNQPRLKLTSSSTEKGFFFEFVSATNLPDSEATHQHRFEIQIHSPDSFTRGETYISKGTLDSGKTTYSRSR